MQNSGIWFILSKINWYLRILTRLKLLCLSGYRIYWQGNLLNDKCCSIYLRPQTSWFHFSSYKNTRLIFIEENIKTFWALETTYCENRNPNTQFCGIGSQNIINNSVIIDKAIELICQKFSRLCSKKKNYIKKYVAWLFWSHVMPIAVNSTIFIL